ncbi:MAG: acyltransferase [Lachnospiraceae bacterium]|jgi:peptidoglycan/LPS O-acetylase OafA/YrhL|nr:acyltransferase [Lachnospiraceae bacterium]
MKGVRNGKIDLLRFVFALIVVLHHTRYLLGDSNCVFLGGSLAVEFFFIVSGWLMAEHTAAEDRRGGYLPGTLGHDTLHFLGGKLRAVLPVFLPAWIAGFVFVAAVRRLSPGGIVRFFCSSFWELLLVKMSGLYMKGFDGVIWYVSAMLLCMAVLYPLLRRFPDMMPKIAAPLLMLFLYGYLCRTFNHPRDPSVWTGLFYKGLLRAMADLCLGVVLRTVCTRFRSLRWKYSVRVFLAVLELFLYTAVVLYMYYRKPSQYDYFFIFLLAAAIFLSFSRQPAGAALFDGKATRFLGRFSAALFFSHIYYAQNLNRILPAEMGRTERVGVYLLCAFLTAAAVLALSDFLRARKRAIIAWSEKTFLENN